MSSDKDPLLHFPLYCHELMSILNKYEYTQQGAFIRVLCGYISEDGQICEASKYRLFGAFCKEEKKAIDSIYKEAVKMAKDIIEKQKPIREKNRENGRKGGRPKKPMG